MENKRKYIVEDASNGHFVIVPNEYIARKTILLSYAEWLEAMANERTPYALDEVADDLRQLANEGAIETLYYSYEAEDRS